MKLPKVPTYFSTQAQVAMLGYIILAVAIMLPVNIEKEEYNLTERVVSLLMMLLPMVVSIYTINCLVKGSSKGGLPCDVLAWLNSGSILVWSVLVLVLTLLIYANNDVEGFWPPRKRQRGPIRPFEVAPQPQPIKPRPRPRPIKHQHEGHPLHEHKKPHIVNKPLPRPKPSRFPYFR